MIAVGMLGGWAGYAIATWGYILIKGWDVPWSQWISPASPYTWPKPPGTPPLIPDSQLFPSSASSAAGAGAQGVGTQGGVKRGGPVVNPRPKKGRVGKTTKPGGPKTGPR